MTVYRVNIEESGKYVSPGSLLHCSVLWQGGCTPSAPDNLLWWELISLGKPILGLKLSLQLNVLLILIFLLWFEPIHYSSPYLLWSSGFCRYKRCLRFYEWVCTDQACRVVFIVRSSLTAYSFAKAQLFRLKLFHARHFPQAVFHPLLFSSSLPFCFKMQPKISAVSENKVREWYRCVMAEWEDFGSMGLFLETLNALIGNLGAGLWLEDQPARC